MIQGFRQCFVFWVCCFVGLRLHAVQASGERPNVLILLADDLGYGDVRCNNPDRSKIPTPNIDRLAEEGMRFTDGHSSSGVCSPSRYTLLTGRYHWRTTLQRGIVNAFGDPLIAPDRETIASLAKRHGYRTACIGKWHLGWDWPVPAGQRSLLRPRPDAEGGGKARKRDGSKQVEPSESQLDAWRQIFSKRIEGGPTTRGFDRYFGTDVPNWPPFCFIKDDRTVGIPSTFLASSLVGNHQASQQGPAVQDWALEPILPALGEQAIAFVSESAAKREPFLLYMPLTAPHTPLAVNAEWKGRSGLNAYADFVMETDATVGRVLEALERSGVAKDTLVVFTADNGCAPYIGVKDLEAKGHFPSGPLRGYKADAWEGGHRVPFIVRWPKVVTPGSVCDHLVYQADILRTVSDILGVTLPDHVGEDSFSFLPLLKGSTAAVRTDGVSASIGGVPAVRQGEWKYIAAPGSGGWSGTSAEGPAVQLYNLSKDLGESKNLAEAMPEKVVEMQALLERLIVEGRSTSGTRQANDVEVIRYPRVGRSKKD
jgi:arylsulfatase A